MFNIKSLINRVTNSNEGSNADESSPSHQQQQLDEDQHSAEGFLCPLCMTAYTSPDALKVHYETMHSESAEANSDDRSDNLSEIGEDIKNMQLEIESLQSLLHKERVHSNEVVEELHKSQSQLKSLNNELGSLKITEKELQAANTLLTSDVTLLRQQLGERIEQISQLRKDKDQAVVNLTGEVDKVKQENTSLKMQLSHKNSVDDAEVLKQELVSVQKMMNQLSLEKEEEISNLKQQISDLNKVAHEREQAFADAQLSFCEKLKAQSPTEVLETQANIKLEQCMSANEQLQKQLAEVETAKDELETLCNNMKMQKQTTEVEINELNKNIHNLKLELEQSSSELAHMTAQYKQQNEQIARLEQELNEKEQVTKALAKSKDEMIGMQEKLDALSLEMESMIKDHEAARQLLEERSKELEAINSNLEIEVKHLTQDLKNSQNTVSDLKNSVSSALEEKRKVSEEVDLLTKEVQELRQIKVSFEKQIQNLQDQKKELTTKVESCKCQITELTTKLENLGSDNSSLTEEVKNQKKEIQDLNEQNDKLKGSYENEISKLKADLRQTVRELEIVQKEKEEIHKSAESTNAQLKKEVAESSTKLQSYQSQIDENENKLIQMKVEMAESSEKAQQLQNQLDTILVEKLEYEKNMKMNEHKYAVLMERCLADANEKEKLHEAMSDLKRKLEDSAAALQELGRENQNLVMENAKMNGRQWADDALVNTCTTCEREFTLTNRKHHCRHCGQIFCKDCSSKTAKIPSSKNPVRVCNACFEELMPK